MISKKYSDNFIKVYHKSQGQDCNLNPGNALYIIITTQHRLFIFYLLGGPGFDSISPLRRILSLELEFVNFRILELWIIVEILVSLLKAKLISR